MIDLKRKENCTGCKACGDICPKGAISFQTDKEGFWYPEVDPSKCVDCHLCEKVCARFGFAESLEVIAGSQPGAGMTKAGVIRLAMERLGLTEAEKRRTVMIGDRKFDVEGAAECGLPCVGVEFFGYAGPGELQAAGAAAVVRTAAELDQYLRSL